MRKMIAPVIIMSTLFYCVTGMISNAIAATHLEILKNEFPYGLLGEDYGLLTVEDLAFNACIAVPQPISDDSNFYPYWQCFETKDVNWECDHGGEQEPGAPVQALLALVIKQSAGKIEYLAPSVMDLSSCKEYKKDLKRLTKGEKHVCLSGELIRFDRDKKREYDAHWTFDKFKTRKGCVAYFDGYCDTKHKRSPCEGE